MAATEETAPMPSPTRNVISAGLDDHQYRIIGIEGGAVGFDGEIGRLPMRPVSDGVDDIRVGGEPLLTEAMPQRCAIGVGRRRRVFELRQVRHYVNGNRNS